MLPALLGIPLLLLWLRSDISARFREGTQRGKAWTMVVLLGLLGAVLGFFVLGAAGTVLFERINLRAAVGAQPKSLECRVVRFRLRRNPGIEVEFEGRRTDLPTASAYTKPYGSENPSDYRVVVTARPGLLGTWIVDDWQLERP
ncbi:hypothetical protein [Flaviaesturariibacter amylovorans]|uniref:DUF3592 domain-containing protein n=1 Tax=Flaviaesturariibacter amylovorans TaxID=1084520 RepID=A0ABP8GST4_9BACT